MKRIPAGEYERIIDVLPILCVDIAAQNEKGDYLLVKRSNPPKKDHWWVIGGRVFKGETLEAAATRKLAEEAGVTATSLTAIGYMELPFDEHPFGLPADYHAVSVVFRATLGGEQAIRLDDQSTEWRWSPDLPEDFPLRTFEGAR